MILDWRLIAAGVLVLFIGGYIWHCEASKKALAEAHAAAEAQLKENARQAMRDMRNKERSDENYSRNIARLDADLRRLRNASPSNLPTAGSAPAGATRACYERSEFDTALRSYRDEVARGREEIRAIVGEGAKAVEGLEEARAWAQER